MLGFSVHKPVFPFYIEGECDDNEFQCFDGICVPDTQLCDASPECKLFEDERECGKSKIKFKYRLAV